MTAPVPFYSKIMKASDISALLPIKTEAMPKIATFAQEPTRLTLKSFQECNQDQAIAIISATEPLLGFLGLILKDASYITINNGNSYILSVVPGPCPEHANNQNSHSNHFTIAQEHYKTYCKFQVILVSMITNCCLLKHPITLTLILPMHSTPTSESSLE